MGTSSRLWEDVISRFSHEIGCVDSWESSSFAPQSTSCFRGHGRCDGERHRKSVRGCIVSQDLSVSNMVIVKKDDNDLPGLTDTEKPRTRGPKRASKIRKLFKLSKEDDVRKYVNIYRREFTTKTGKKVSKAPKIQYYSCYICYSMYELLTHLKDTKFQQLLKKLHLTVSLFQELGLSVMVVIVLFSPRVRFCGI